eukprot:GHVS01004759.1.p2 GENE.GHVS01004759.1~~GHVS01004759.1.p2  ORF type:complete len:113 (+),score=7.70 GHVS01004759.1:391-729(+)
MLCMWFKPRVWISRWNYGPGILFYVSVVISICFGIASGVLCSWRLRMLLIVNRSNIFVSMWLSLVLVLVNGSRLGGDTMFPGIAPPAELVPPSPPFPPVCSPSTSIGCSFGC